MKTLIKIGCWFVAAVAAFAASAAVKWSYNAETTVLAQIDAPEGETPWEFYLTNQGELSKKVNGTGAVLDLREETWPAGMPDIKTFPRLEPSGLTTCEEVYLPDTVTALNGNTSYTFWNWKNLKVVRLSAGLTQIPADTFFGTALQQVDIYGGAQNLCSFLHITTLNNVVFHQKGTIELPGGCFHSCTALREITWNGWFNYTKKYPYDGQTVFYGWKDLQCRFIVPGDNIDWLLFTKSAEVTPWDKCSDADKTAYLTKYGSDAQTPVGITVSTYNAGGLPKTYIVVNGGFGDRVPLFAETSNPEHASVSVNPAPGDDGLYARGDVVTISVEHDASVEFRGWTGDVADEDKAKTTIAVTMDDIKSVKAVVVSGSFAYDSAAGTISDGEQTIAVTESDAGLTLGAVTAHRDDGVLDLRKPVDSGDLIVAIPKTWAKDSGVDQWATDIYLPEGLQSIGENAFFNDKVVRHIVPMFPKSVTNVGRQCLYGCSNLESPFEVGYGVDEEGDPLEVTMPADGYLLYTAYNIPALRFGPGVKSLGAVDTCYVFTSPRFVEFGPNLTTIAKMPQPQSGKGLTNAVFHQTGVIELPRGCFHSQGSLREITWDCWFTYTPTPTASGDTVFYNWKDKQCRFLVPGDNPDWISYILDPARVTPWSDLAPATRSAYYDQYGADAAQPAGLSVAVSGGLPQTWIVQQESGFEVGEIEAQPWGARPVPKLRDVAGNALPADGFDFTYLNVDAPGTAVVVAKGKAGTAYAGKSNFATFVLSARVDADTFTWAVAADGAFEDNVNWTSASGAAGHPELPGDVAVLPTFADDASYSVTVSKRLTVKALTVGDTEGIGGAGTATLVFGTLDARNTFSGDVHVKANGVITHAGPGDFQKDIVYLDVGGGMAVEAGGFVTATARGHNSMKGKGWNDNRSLCSPGYAGYGHSDSSSDCDVKKHADFRNVAYGSVLRPTDWGTGANAGATAGGAIRLVVAGTLTVDGTVEADGFEEDPTMNYAGTGGSVWITCGQIVGAGSVTAMEGAKNTVWGCGVNGSGGRIAIYQTVAKDFDAFPRSQISTMRVVNGAAGTVYLEHAGSKLTGGWLYLEEDLQARHRTPIPMADDGDPETAYANVNVIVKGGAVLSVEADTKVRDLSVQESDDTKLKPYVFLNGRTLKVRSLRHKGGKRWFESYAQAIEDGWIDLGGTDDTVGRIEWVGGVSGLLLIVK